jgi:hypothetical protein
MLTLARRPRYRHGVTAILHKLDGNDGVGACGDGASGGDPGRSTRRELARRRAARRHPKGHGELSRGVVRPNRESIHRGTRKGGKVDDCPRRLTDDAPTGVRDPDRLDREEPCVLEDAFERVLDRQELGH